ncbi:helicase associated domain-containing protein [Arthrobacter antibioticus]|uniref:helicase associated domain-containing protein n=1 Tax=Arthrobacter sp. H35-MC1 TaxID=3046203 RepID=UPI0024BB3D87|nr:helicase associated domain-containing protein [Arthrobacter sp. H35-MC1]MDJ0315775.1 helicase associated domain-containing protein [Arthrobacter sp. H35-MC1]
MAGWEVSRHPEWDMMYAAGLTVREISDRCQKKRNTVHLHLQTREKHQLGLRAQHETALALRGSDWLPHYDGNQTEKSLHTWVSEQQRAYHRGELSAPKIVLMGSLPNWDVPIRPLELEQHWQSRFNQIKEHISATGQLPRYRAYATEEEHTLGVWLHIQRQKRTEKTLEKSRLNTLNTAIPHWRSHT